MRLSLGRRREHDAEHHAHHVNGVKRAQQIEGVFDMLVVLMIAVLIAAMAYGLLTTSGSAPWMD